MNIAIKPENISSREALVGKVSLVTGSTSGISLGIARALAAAGSEIVLNRRGCFKRTRPNNIDVEF
jgi:3-hydroxybutyrate dehydrogenase